MEAGSSKFLEDPIQIDVKNEKIGDVEEHNFTGYLNTKFKKIWAKKLKMRLDTYSAGQSPWFSSFMHLHHTSQYP